MNLKRKVDLVVWVIDQIIHDRKRFLLLYQIYSDFLYKGFPVPPPLSFVFHFEFRFISSLYLLHRNWLGNPDLDYPLFQLSYLAARYNSFEYLCKDYHLFHSHLLHELTFVSSVLVLFLTIFYKFSIQYFKFLLYWIYFTS